MKSKGAAKNEANNAAQIAASAPAAEKSAEKIDFSNVKIEPLFEEMVDFETFSKSDIGGSWGKREGRSSSSDGGWPDPGGREAVLRKTGKAEKGRAANAYREQAEKVILAKIIYD